MNGVKRLTPPQSRKVNALVPVSYTHLSYPVNYSCIKGYGLMNWN